MKRRTSTMVWAGAMALAALTIVVVRARGNGATTRPDGTANDGGVSISGQVSIAAGWELQRPDLSRVVVYLGTDAILDARPVPTEPAQMAQRDKAFIPDFLVVSRGTAIEFPNWDHFDHNVFSRSAAAPAFDLKRYPYGESKSRIFDKLGVVQLFCNIHPDMRALIVVTPNRFFTRADARGHFELRHVPPGQYDVVVWQERCGEQHKSADTRAGAVTGLNVTLDQNRQSILANDPPRLPANYGVERGLGVKRETLNLPTVDDAHPAPQTPPGK
jgi:plastocyanin